ncbi:MAG: fused MFS/spermidine synthase [Bdellovibrio sp.]|nr:fused MFS/spermidine synthase [Bdellovibrio sp.]
MLAYFVVYLTRITDQIIALCILITLLLLQVSFYAFKIMIAQSGPPIWSVLWALSNTALIPLLTLAMATPLLQDIIDSDLNKNSKILLIFSNFGSLLGLIFYPLVGDTFFGLETRRLIWQYASFACSVVVLLIGMNAYSSDRIKKMESTPYSFPFMLSVRWFFYSFLTCLLMLAVTNFITHGLGSVPLLWMIPMGIYLGTFWMAFTERFANINRYVRIYGPILWGILQVLSYIQIAQNTFLLHLRNYLFLFLATLIVNSELYQKRPSQNLSSFYLVLNLGGACATLLVSVLIPNIDLSLSNVYLEFVLAIFFFAVFLIVRDYEKLKKSVSAKIILGTVLILIVYQLSPTVKNELDSKRNFYGLVRILEENGEILMAHGNTVHGGRKIDPKYSGMPLVYYHPKSGVGEAFSFLSFPKKVASIGLGAGSILYYAYPGDDWDLLEINQNVYDLALKHFNFLGRTKARYHLQVGDGRLLMQQSKILYDLIVLDAFSSDSIPLHLMTREAFELYLGRLNPGGLMLLHLSNNYCDFLKVIAPIAHALKLEMAYAKRQIHDQLGKSDSLWAVLSKDVRLVQNFKTQKGWESPGQDLLAHPLWTDDWQGLLSILNFL